MWAGSCRGSPGPVCWMVGWSRFWTADGSAGPEEEPLWKQVVLRQQGEEDPGSRICSRGLPHVWRMTRTVRQNPIPTVPHICEQWRILDGLVGLGPAGTEQGGFGTAPSLWRWAGGAELWKGGV